MRHFIRYAGSVTAAILLAAAAALTFAEPSAAIPNCGPEDLDCEIPDPTLEPLDPTFTWFMPRRYEAAWNAWDEQGAVDHPATAGYAQSYVNPGTFYVYLNGCRSQGDRVVQHVWRVVGNGQDRTLSGGCLRAERLPQGSYQVTHTEYGVDGDTAVQRRTVTVRDFLIVSLGDSNASGEGNPDDPDWGPGDDLDWKDDRCHRSATSGPALFAEELEDKSPHSSVTFLSFACSGADILDGLIGEYAGIEPPVRLVDEPYPHFVPANYLPPQVDTAKRHLCGGADGCTQAVRPVDALLISIGVNDLGFAGLMQECAKPIYWDCDTSNSVNQELSRAFRQLPGTYAQLADALTGPLAEAPVFLTEYPGDPFDSHDGCGTMAGVNDAEGKWLADQGEKLNRLIRSAALQHGWVSVGGITDAFAGHGYCAYHSWFRSLSESYIEQNNIYGAMHPNHLGHEATAAAIADAFANAEALDPTPTHRATVRVEAVRVTDPGVVPEVESYQTGIQFWSYAAATGPGGASAKWDVEMAAFPSSTDAVLPLGQWVALPAQPYTLTVDLASWQDLWLEAETTLPPWPPESCLKLGKYVPNCFDQRPRDLSINERLRPTAGWSEGTHTAQAIGDGATLEVRYTVSVSPIVLPWQPIDPKLPWPGALGLV